MAINEPQLYRNIQEAVTGVLFLGTPHRGSVTTSFSNVLVNVANVALMGASQVTDSMRSNLINSLKKDWDELRDISTEFQQQKPTFSIISLIEQRITPPFRTRVCKVVVIPSPIFFSQTQLNLVWFIAFSLSFRACQCLSYPRLITYHYFAL
jgi:hypothetical protein